MSAYFTDILLENIQIGVNFFILLIIFAGTALFRVDIELAVAIYVLLIIKLCTVSMIADHTSTLSVIAIPLSLSFYLYLFTSAAFKIIFNCMITIK
jgi:hypothetical protein